MRTLGRSIIQNAPLYIDSNFGLKKAFNLNQCRGLCEAATDGKRVY